MWGVVMIISLLLAWQVLHMPKDRQVSAATRGNGDDIGTNQPEYLPDANGTIYCRSAK
jgi:hypothetical protein